MLGMATGKATRMETRTNITIEDADSHKHRQQLRSTNDDYAFGATWPQMNI